MATIPTKLMTVDDLQQLHSAGVGGELIAGVFSEKMPVGGKHGEVAVALAAELLGFVRPRRLGRVAGTDAGVRLERDPDTVREPDVAYISAETLPLDVNVDGYYEVVPDLVIEITSPSDAEWQAHDKARMWLSFGVSMAWVVDPRARTVDVHVPGEARRRLGEDDELDGGDVLPGFRCSVSQILDI